MEKKDFQIKIMFYILLKGIEEVAKVDEDLQEDMEDFEAKIQWKVGPFRGYQIFEEGKYSFAIDEEIEEPDVTMEIEDLDIARQFFGGELDGTTAYMSGDLKIDGDLQLIMEYGSFAEYLTEYIAPLTGR